MPLRHHFLRRAPVPLVAFGLVFAGLAPSALAANVESDESPASRAEATDAPAAREPTGVAARVIDSPSEAAERGSFALEAAGASGDGSSARDAGARRERSDDSPASTGSVRSEDGESSAGREGDESEDGEPSLEAAVDRSLSGVRDRARPVAEKAATTVEEEPSRAVETVGKHARPVVAKARDTVEKTQAATRPVIDEARAIAGRGIDRVRGDGPSKPPPGAEHPAPTARGSSAPQPRVGASPREPLPASGAPAPLRLVTPAVERSVPMPASAASPPPARRRLASAPLRAREHSDREHAASRRAGSPPPLVRLLDQSGSARVAPLEEDPSGGSSSRSGGGLSSISLVSGGMAATIGAFCLTAPSLLRRLCLSPALVRPVAFVSLLERPG